MILSPSTVIEMYVFFGLKCSPRHLFSPKLCCYDARGRYRSSDTNISSCQVQNTTGGDDLSSNRRHWGVGDFAVGMLHNPPVLTDALLLRCQGTL